MATYTLKDIFKESRDKIFKGDLGEIACQRFLQDLGFIVNNLNHPKRNQKGIDLFVKDPLEKLSQKGQFVVSCRGGIRNYNNDKRYNRPENDRQLLHRYDKSKTDGKKGIKEEQAEIYSADLFYSLAFFYPR